MSESRCFSRTNFSRGEKCHLNEIEREREGRSREDFRVKEEKKKEEEEEVITEGIEVFEGCSEGKSKIFSPMRLHATLNEIAC